MTVPTIPVHETHAGCGGTILAGMTDDYSYCDRCHAFRAIDSAETADRQFPTGTDKEKNLQAWDNAEARSPEEHEGETR